MARRKRSQRIGLALVTAGALAFLAACGTVAPVPVAPLRMQAIDANKQAAALFERADYAAALAKYRQALTLERAIENENGIAINAINLSIVYQRLGEREDAHAALREILESRLLQFPAQRIAEAAFRSAVLLLEAEDVAAASAALARARAACAEPGCGLAGHLLNVQAQIALLGKDYAGARALADQALAINRQRAETAELANSLRLLGAALLELEQTEAAQRAMTESLALDKNLSEPSKILRDLRLLGRIAAARGAKEEAKTYYERALAVARAAGDRQAAVELEHLVRGLP